MTTEMEKKFFKAFGIEPKPHHYECKHGTSSLQCCPLAGEIQADSCVGCKQASYMKMVYSYPQITDRILLQLIVICLNNDFVVHSKNLNELQEKILYLLTQNANNKDILYAVRKLFEVEEQ